MSQKVLLLVHKCLHSANIEATSLVHSSKLILKPGFQNVEAILGELFVQLIEIRDRAYRREYSVVWEGVVPGTERGNRGDTLCAAEGAEGVVLYIATLKRFRVASVPLRCLLKSRPRLEGKAWG